MNDCKRSTIAAVAFFLGGAVILPLLSLDLAHAADPVRACTEADREYAELSGSGAADEAYDFGLKIQKAVAAEDVAALYDLVIDDLQHGPRRAFVEGKSFSEIFSNDWREDVLSAEPACQPVGWRGYMLGSGAVWYAQVLGDWTIVSINGAAIEPVSSEPWIHGDDLLTRACFETRWISKDNYEEYRERFALDAEFEIVPGRYIGGQVPLEPIEASWGDSLSLAVGLSECVTDEASGTAELVEGWVFMKTATDECADGDDPSVSCPRYRVVRLIRPESCDFLAPNFPNTCREMRLVEIVDPTGGSMGDDVSVGIFGIVESSDDGKAYVIPLVNFDTLNEGLNFVDAIER